ncbi:MAG TPA: 4Fe-4S dicluster domain-containing protein, partial [Spirochaetia bacterium]|nr:4Fe-4S dicluster domain-containing protein [Spirochaetia bacterium]
SIKPRIDAAACTFCGKCIEWCPEDAIVPEDVVEKSGKAFILEKKCIGCGECLSVCNFDAVKYNWGVESSDLQKRVAEHALGAVQNKRQKSFFINCLTDMTGGCDCMGNRQDRIMGDVGVLASTDPVAIDQATLDLTEKHFGESLAKKSYPQIDASLQLEHGERIGLGSRAYRLVDL